ncbi:hypothetical protein VB776_07535 [Arcicella sp. DC2W]|uniref:Uncharacterized protein n=1 Tax=Arcicella gelida TaxID=2984195 RepID=A0ABU5S2R7_9BACT|nr:hypothetical protein [Arcicella sp. DC2W]MEA5402760.1 hypothetical protein [Arcicella sp. DC2W]
MRKTRAILITTILSLFYNISPAQSIDNLYFGDSESAKLHQVNGQNIKTIQGGLAQPAIVLLPPTTASWTGGLVTFTLKIDKDNLNYLTAKFWGNDVTQNRLYLVCEGKQIGSRHLGDIDMLDIGNDAPFYNDRFFYTTTPLPLSLTKGKSEIQVEIRSNGPIWGYGQTWDKYQKDMVEPTRGIYAVYSHTNPDFVPDKKEKQGIAPTSKIRKSPNEDVLVHLKERINKEVLNLLQSSKPLSQVQMQFLAKAYHTQWTKAYHNPAVIKATLNGIDELYKKYLQNPRLAYSDPATWNADWFGLGICGQIIYLLRNDLAPSFSENITDLAVSRKEAYSKMLLDCRISHQQNRRLYTNQSMINDLYGIYYANKGLQIIAPEQASSESKVLDYLYQSVGLTPWLGSDDKEGNPTKTAGNNYWQLTEKGLTKELGYVGNYGEVLDWTTEIYEATKSDLLPDGDAKIKAQIDKIALARTYFRYPTVDNEGNQTMRVETVVGWRDTHYPGDVCYVQRPSWDGGPFQMAAATMNPKLVAYSQKMLSDNQFFAVVEERMKNEGFRVTAGLLEVPEQYEKIKNHQPLNEEMPLGWKQPNLVFSDEENGVIVIKNKQEILYASLYWRARNAINNLARVHYITPTYNNIATVTVDERFEDSGNFYTMPNYTNMAFGNGGVKYPDGLVLAHAGEKQPIAKIPVGMKYKVGDENPYAGRANFYQLEYGKYFIVMNNSKNKITNIAVPMRFKKSVNVASGEEITNKSISLEPMSSMVLYQK